MNALEKCWKEPSAYSKEKPLRLADLGCGGGDRLKLIAKKARKRNIPVDLVGVDANAFIVDFAKKNTKEFKEIKYLQQDVLSEKFKGEKYDLIHCTLFCHHFDDLTLKNLLRDFRQHTTTAIIINDIHRHWLAYYSIKWLTYFFSKSSMVKFDAKLSVLRAFRKKELVTIIKEAGYKNYTINWKWAFRYEVIIYI
jgi:2-polyprenyl-3-methyl-5-hydroxy-6-metoxy-1,4-benzoquinol methylase